jgi:hypothetical protein
LVAGTKWRFHLGSYEIANTPVKGTMILFLLVRSLSILLDHHETHERLKRRIAASKRRTRPQITKVGMKSSVHRLHRFSQIMNSTGRDCSMNIHVNHTDFSGSSTKRLEKAQALSYYYLRRF